MPALPEKSNLPAPDAEWPSRRLRWVLLGAFVGLLALLFVSGAAATRTLREMHQQEQEARRIQADRAQTMSGLYISIEVYNNDIGRYMGYPAEKSDPQVRRQVDQLTVEIAAGLSRYPDHNQPEEAAFLQAIHDLYQRHLDLYRSALAAPVPPEARDEIVIMRSQILDWSRQFSAWNGRQLHANDETLLAQFGRLQASLTGSLAIALGAGLLSFGGAAAAGTRRIRAIEVEMAVARNVYESQAKHAQDHGVRTRMAERAVESASAEYRADAEKKTLAELIDWTLQASNSGSRKD